jgi:hypothetical protein
MSTYLVDPAPVDDEAVGDDEIERLRVRETCRLSHAFPNDFACGFPASDILDGQ